MQFAGSTASYFLADHLGSVRQLTNASGAVTLAKSYQPYGAVLNSNGTGASMYGFTGEVTDNTGLVYLRARYYAPGQARFVTADPSRFENNLYQFAMSNPINRTDPSGLFSKQQIARAYGYASFDVMTLDLLNSTPIMSGERPNWGWIAALLDAQPGDTIRTGMVNILPWASPYIEWMRNFRMLVDLCNDIWVDWVGPVRIAKLLKGGVREDRYHLIRGSGQGYGYYVDGDDWGMTSIPDLYTVDAVGCFANQGWGPASICGTYSRITNRLGEVFNSVPLPALSAGYSPTSPYPVKPTLLGGPGFASGYINPVELWTSRRLVPSRSTVASVSRENCLLASVSIVFSAGLAYCNGTNGILFRGISASIGISAGPAVSLYSHTDYSKAWDRYVQEEVDGWNWARVTQYSWTKP